MSQKAFVIESNLPKTAMAVAFAVEKHRGQVRKVSGLPYLIHALNVMQLVRQYKTSNNIDDIAAAAVLHDVVEDCGVTVQELRIFFGNLVAILVSEVTANGFKVDERGKEYYWKCKLLTMGGYSKLIKLCDILANLSDMPAETAVKRVREIHDYVIKNDRFLTGSHKRVLAQIDRTLIDIYECPTIQ